MNSIKYRKDIDGLRAVAVLSVVFFHGYPDTLPGGYIGVDIFFVISGYLISRIIYDGIANNTFSFIEFYLRRVRRIFPALILVLTISFIFGWQVLTADEYKQLGKHIAGGAGFISNLFYWQESGYFDNAAITKPLLHIWSLGIEEQFYILWPLILLLFMRLGLNLIILIIGLMLASFLFNIVSINHDLIATFYNPLTRFWELLSGSILAWLMHKKNDLKAIGLITKNLASLFGIFLIFLCCKYFHSHFKFPGWWALLPILGAVLVIAAGQEAFINKRVLSNKIFVWFGLISYPLYLWHWPLLSFYAIVFGETTRMHVIFRILLVSVLLAWLTYKFIEKPLRNSQNNKNSLYLILIMIGILLLGFCTNTFLKGFEKRTFLKSINPNYLEAAIDWQYSKDLKEKTVNNVRVHQNFDLPMEVLIVGDSHAEVFGPRVVAISKKQKTRTIAFLTAGGLPLDNVFSKSGKSFSRQNDLEKIFVSSPSLKRIVIAGYWNQILHENKNIYCVDVTGIKNIFPERRAQECVFTGIEILLKKLVKNYEVYLLLDSPQGFEYDPRRVINRDFNGKMNRLLLPRDGIPLTFPSNEVFLNEAQKTLNEDLIKVANNAGVKIINQLPTLCPDQVCMRVFDKDKPVFKDDHHLRPGFVIDNAHYFDVVLY